MILEESPLGSGQFGEVFKGRWFDPPDEEGNSGIFSCNSLVSVKIMRMTMHFPEKVSAVIETISFHVDID